jgi:O-antigen ligase
MTTTFQAHAPQSTGRALSFWLGALALLAPSLVAHHLPPSVTYFNQALAVFGWGLFAAGIGRSKLAVTPARLGQGMLALDLMLLLIALEAFGSAFVWGELPGGLGLMGSGMCLAALLALRAGWRAGHEPLRLAWVDAFFWALVLAGIVGMILGLIQAFHPQWADGAWIARPTMPGRAVGNLRQPNHLSTLLVWSCCAAAWLGARRKMPPMMAVWLLAIFIWGIVLTASRTGMIAMVFLAIWGLLDKRMPRPVRAALVGAPLIYGAWWGGMWLLAQTDKSVAFAAEARLHDGSDISSSRFKIWANVFELIRQHPWFGVGYGEFNVAWTLTPFPGRPVAFFDHTHNLLFQWAVEFGVPMAVLLTCLAGWAWWSLLSAATDRDETDSDANATVGACTVIVSIAGLHSLLEYPLWYSYFLLPTAFAWGLGLSVRHAGHGKQEAKATPGPASMGMTAGGLIMAGLIAWCTYDYATQANIYAPFYGARSLDERIKLGQQQLWWGYQADYADVTGVDDDEPAKPPRAFHRTLHNLLDARLMMAYSRSLAEHGELDKARYVVERLREFRNSLSDSFLAACKSQLEQGEEPPYQCEPPKQQYSWRQILPP